MKNLISFTRNNYFKTLRYGEYLYLTPGNADFYSIFESKLISKYIKNYDKMNIGRQMIERDRLLEKQEVQTELISKYFASEYANIYKYHYYIFNKMKPKRNKNAINILIESLANDKLKLIDLLYCISENNDSIATILDDSYNDQLSVLNIHKKKNSFAKFFSNSEMGTLIFSLPLNALKDYFSSHRSVVFRMLDGRFIKYGEGAMPPDLLENFDHYASMYNHTPSSSSEK